MFFTEKNYFICPTSDIKESPLSEDDKLFSSGVTLEHEFSAAIKELNYIEETIHIRGNLNSEWSKKVKQALISKKDIEMPLFFDKEKFYAGFKTMQRL